MRGIRIENLFTRIIMTRVALHSTRHSGICYSDCTYLHGIPNRAEDWIGRSRFPKRRPQDSRLRLTAARSVTDVSQSHKRPAEGTRKRDKKYSPWRWTSSTQNIPIHRGPTPTINISFHSSYFLYLFLFLFLFSILDFLLELLE